MLSINVIGERSKHMNATPEPPTTRGSEQGGSTLDQELEFLWQDRGRSGQTYDVYLGRISRNPVVRSRVSGKYFMVPWSQIIDLAFQKGIDQKTNTVENASPRAPLRRASLSPDGNAQTDPDAHGGQCWGWGINE
jgi:hypothetical protein